MADTKPAQKPEILQCTSPACSRELARWVKHCPYCGKPQIDEAPEFLPSPTAAPGRHKSKLAEKQAGLPQKPQSPPQKTDPAYEPVVVPNSPTITTSESIVTAPTLPKEDPPPSKGRGWMVITGLIAAAAVAYWVFSRHPAESTVDVGPQWTTLDLSKAAVGTDVTLSSDGPFRLRSAGVPPVLVDDHNGAVNLDAIHRTGLQAKSANGATVHITVSADR